MYTFKVGSTYYRNSKSGDPVTVTKRTDKTIWVTMGENFLSWTMRIRKDNQGNEWAVESRFDHQTNQRYREDMMFMASNLVT